MKTFEYEPIFNKTVLENGVRVLTEHHPYSRGVTSGIMLDLGTRDEPADMSGAAHFVEHMVFKGTETRDAYEIVKSLEAVGGDLNAYTTREQTCFHSTTLKEHLPLALDVLTDLMSNATFDPADLKKEREVILQEIKMAGDQVDEHIYDVFFENIYKGSDLARSILGTPKTLAGISRSKIFDFYSRRYHGQNMIVSVAGHVDHEEVVGLIRRTLRARKKTFTPAPRKRPTFKSFAKAINKPGEQVHFLMGTPSCSMKDELRYAAYIVNAAIGGGMTSRLYQKVREKAGLSYSVYSHIQPFSDSGLFMLYAGTSSQNLSKVKGIILKELESVYKKGLSANELEFFKRQIMGSYILECDDVDSRMNSIAMNEIAFGQSRQVDNTLRDLEAVTIEDVHTYVKRYLDLEKLGLLVMGDCNEDKVSRELEKHLS